MIIAADLGGTRIKLGVIMDGKCAAHTSFPAASKEGLERALPAIADEIDCLLATPDLDRGRLDAVGLAFPGLVDPKANQVCATFGKWDDAKGIDFDAWAKTRFSLPLVMENDTRLALLGEWRFGAGVGCNNLVLVTLGTGIGTAVVIEGNLLKGVHGQAGVLGGHFGTNRQGNRCFCGNIGCGETEASTSVITRIAAERSDFATSALKTREVIDFSTIFAFARKCDPCAQALKAHSISVWAQVIVNLIHAYDCERVILGGGVMSGAGDFLDELKAAVLSNANTPWGKVDIVIGALGSSAALLGLDILAHQHFPALP